MPTDVPANLTLALLLTAAGVTIAAGLVAGIVQLIKSIWPGDIAGIWQLRTAFVVAAVLTGLAYASGVQSGAITISIESLFAAGLAWYGIARGAKAIFDDLTAAPGSLRA